ncbi:MAG: 50S ribosomal protein L3 [Candidatus Aenigmarchaeota archaeon]|nr:50S ribosomal protein L3 [Candidatus Aenigmarchaeota archaeon]
MPQRKRPGRGSKAFYPRKRARRIYPRIKSWPKSKEVKLLGFAGYKAGMSHVILIDNNPNSTTRGQQITRPITILDCPPLSVFGFRCYINNKSSSDVFSEKIDKNLSRKIKVPKKPKNLEEQLSKIPKNVSKINLICRTNPNFKKKPEIFEIALGGFVEEQLKYAKEVLGKEIKASDVFKEGDLVDVVAVTKGKGFEGPVKRFGVRTHWRKAQQMQRHVAPLGQNEPGKVRWTIPQAGQTGFQTRNELNKRILKISDGFNVKGGFVNYGNVSGDCVLLEGSVPGPKKRLIRLRFAIRPKKVYPVDIKYTSTESKQGV